MSTWKTLNSKIVYENKWMLVHEDEVINPAGTETLYGYVASKSDAVYVVPIDEDGDTYIVQQYRYPLKQVLWEAVAGRIDGDDVKTAALRELLEETGIKAETVTVLGDVYAATGISTFKCTICVARGLTKVTDELDETDGILAIEKVPFSEIPARILAGTIQCSQSITAFLMTKAYLEGGKT
jgi:8-oxo-dGTP pyrophosphatase MutT (NUDIX family)